MTTFWCELALIGDVVRERVSIDIADGRFAAIQPDTDPAADSTRLTGFTIPGMANAHSHAFHRALRGRTQVGNGSFWTWRDVMYRAAQRLDPDSYHRLARAVFGEMALAGVTSAGEFHYVHHGADGTPYAEPNAMGEALAVAATDVGVRLTLLDTLYLHGGLTADGYAEPDGVQRRFSDGDVERWADRLSALRLPFPHRSGAAVHSVRAVHPAALSTVREWAAGSDAVVHAHVSEQPAENEQCVAQHGATPTQLLHDAGLLEQRFTAVHATHLCDEDVALYVSVRPTVCLCPTTERDLGDGVGPSARLAAAGVPMCLGTDSHAVIDMFAEARAVEMDDRLVAGRRGIHGAADLLAMATVRGHTSLGWHDAGVIAPGNRADLVSVSLSSVRTVGAPHSAAAETAVFSAAAVDVTDVIVDGVPIVTDCEHTRINVAGELTTAIAEVMAG